LGLLQGLLGRGEGLFGSFYLEQDSKEIAMIRCRLRFNWCLLNQSLHMRGEQISSPACICAAVEESPLHVIDQCPRFDAMRSSLRVEFLLLGVPRNLITVLSNLDNASDATRECVRKISGIFLRHIHRVRSM